MNACKVRVMREGMEYQCITEDYKTRVYLSVMREVDEEKMRRELNARKRLRTKKKVMKFFRTVVKPAVRTAAIELGKFVFGVAAGFLAYLKLEERLRVLRGYDAIGGEIFFAIMVSVIAYYVADFLLERWEVR